MKKVLSACIELILEFDSIEEYKKYLADMQAKKQTYVVLYECDIKGKYRVRIRRQYNNNTLID